MADFSGLEVNPFAFAVTRENARLLPILNAALEAIPASEQMEILRRWSGGNLGIIGVDRLHLSASEQRWVQKIHGSGSRCSMISFLIVYRRSRPI